MGMVWSCVNTKNIQKEKDDYNALISSYETLKAEYQELQNLYNELMEKNLQLEETIESKDIQISHFRAVLANIEKSIKF